MIIDAHTHIGMKWPDLGENVSVDYTIDMMERSGVDRIISSASRMMRSDLEKGNRITADIIRRYPKQVLGYVCADPLQLDRSIMQIEHYMKMPAFVGIKIHVSHNGVRYDHPSYDAIYEQADKRSAIVLAHTFGEKDVMQLLHAAQRYPNAQFLAGHSGGYDWYRLSKVMKQTPNNVYWDLCCSTTHANRVETMVALAGAKKVVFGSDAPMLPFSLDLTQVQKAEISKVEKQDILCGNITKMMQCVKNG